MVKAWFILALIVVALLPTQGFAQTITTVVGTGVAGYSGDGGAATAAQLNGTDGLAFDKSGNLLVGDYYNNTIRKISPAGIITTIAGTGASGNSGDGGLATAAKISQPEGICVDNAGNIYFVARGFNLIKKISTIGIISTIAGTGLAGYTGDGGPATAARLNQPIGISIDNAGDLFICDDGNNVIREINTAGIITTIAGTGTAGFSGDGGPATAAMMSDPGELALDNAGNLYVSDRGNYRIRKISSTGIITTIAGGTSGYYGDGGPATAAWLDFVCGLSLDNSGNLYFCDTYNNVIRKIDNAGIITTVAGSGYEGYTGDGGPPRCAQLDIPVSVIFDNAGNYYISDGNNNVVRKVTPGGIALSVSQPVDRSVCPGGQLSFSVNSPTAASYQWQINYGPGWYNLFDGNNFPGVYAGSTTATLNISVITSFMNGYQYRCVVTAACNDLASAPATLTVSPDPATLVTIQSDALSICAGSPAHFTAIPGNGGATPSYQWTLNGINVGTNSPNFVENNPVLGDLVNVTMTSSLACTLPASGDQVYVTPQPVVSPAASISASAISICSGQPVSFNVTATNGGSSPTFQWLLNGANTGTNSVSYSNSNLSDGEIVSCILTSNATCISTPTAVSNAITMAVNTGSGIPSVSIVSSPPTVCPGNLMTFTATAVDGGSAPTYQWMVNGVPAGTNSAVFAVSSLANGDLVNCQLTGSVSCTNPAISNSIVVSLTTGLMASVNITASATAICGGSPVLFTAIPTNGGTAPTYDWLVNGTAAGGTGPLFSTAALADGDQVSCMMTGNSTCTVTPTASSNIIVMGVTPSVTPSVSITGPASASCNGSLVTLAAIPVNGGVNPSYQWVLNGSATGVTGPVYTSTTLADGDQISCTLTGDAVCSTQPTATSNIVTMAITQPLMPSVSVTASATKVCTGGSVTFTATPVNGGTSPSYKWLSNGNTTGPVGPVFTTAYIANGDIITCQLTSDAGCVTTTTALSDPIAIIVIPGSGSSLSITASATTICAETPVTFTATATNPGTSPGYQWLINGVAAGTNATGNTWLNANLNNGDIVSCILTPGTVCGVPASSGNITMTVNPKPFLSMGADRTIDLGGSIQLTPMITIIPAGTGGASSYRWTPAGGLNNPSIADPMAAPSVNTKYQLEVTTDGGCKADGDITVRVINGNVGIPNAFTPNGDGHNDIFYVGGGGITRQIKEFDIFKRDGQKLFGVTDASPGDPAFGWDGKYHGQPVEIGTYIYNAVLLMVDGTTQQFKGTVTLVR